MNRQMGLTISYNIKYSGKNPEIAVEKMRQMAMDLPFNHVSELKNLKGEECKGEVTKAWVTLPWSKTKEKIGECSTHVDALSAHMFTIDVADGSEWALIGLAVYPKTIEVEYRPEADVKFRKVIKDGGSTSCRFDWSKWSNYTKKNNVIGASGWYRLPEQCREIRTIRVGEPKNSWQGFCKTQYASSPDCGGIANFLRCHIALIKLLEQIRIIPGVTVGINDEGHYGEANYSDDYEEAYAAGLTPTYIDHVATHDIKELSKQVGGYNAMIAGLMACIGDNSIESPIKSFANFEELASIGQKEQFERLDQMASLTRQMAKKCVVE